MRHCVIGNSNVLLLRGSGAAVCCCSGAAHFLNSPSVADEGGKSVCADLFTGGNTQCKCYIIDRNTGAGFDYPNAITVILNRVAAAVGMAPSAKAEPQPK